MSVTHVGQLERLPESWLSASSSSGEALIRPIKGLIRLFKGLIRPFKGLIRLFKGLIRPFKGLIRLFKGLIRPLRP